MADNIEAVSRAVDFIEANLEQKIDLNTVARAANYSRYHLHRIFYHTVGITIHDYILRRRLTEAAKLLIFSQRRVLDIAVISGYETQQAFTSAFKAMYKQPPHQFRRNGAFYPLQLRFTVRQAPALAEISPHKLAERITEARSEDIPAWMELVHMSVDGFPYFRQSSYLPQLERAIREKRALILRDGERASGVLVFQRETGSIDFMAVHPQYRRRGVEQAFLDKLMGEYLKGRELSITTFRAGDKADTGYRAVCRQLGFAQAELLVEFGYPTQRMVLVPQCREAGKDGE